MEEEYFYGNQMTQAVLVESQTNKTVSYVTTTGVVVYLKSND